MVWFQTELTLGPLSRGCHLITRELVETVRNEIVQLQLGLFHAFIKHTSASLTINENADPDVRVDMETALNILCPEDMPFIHTMEGPDDMPAHVKSSMLGSSVSIPITDGRLNLGTWQGVYLCEHRDRATPRTIVLTMQGCGDIE